MSQVVNFEMKSKLKKQRSMCLRGFVEMSTTQSRLLGKIRGQHMSVYVKVI